jgi:hypothetical protein
MRARPFLTMALLSTAACAPDFKKRSEVFDLRVIAIVAEPLEAGPGDRVTLRAVTAAPAGVTVAEEEWRFCPFSLGSAVGYECAVPACDVREKLAAGAAVDHMVDVDLSQDACLAAAIASGVALPERVEAIFRYRATGSDGVERVAVLRLPLYADPPWLKAGSTFVHNLAPFFDPIRPFSVGSKPIGAATTVARGAKVDVCAPLAPDSAQSYAGAAGEALTEALVVSFYTTAGTFDFDRANGPEYCARLEAPAEAGTALLWAVGRDLRGGQVAAGPFTVTIQ